MHLHDLLDLVHVRNQPLWRRLIHRTTRRHLVGVGLGTTLMLTGSSLAIHPWELVPHFLWDAFAYSIHGIGFIPLAKHAEPLWDILAGITK